LLLCAARGLASLGAYATGFRALSDDDYARITIAQRFAEGPRFDPSRTSWLPAPFWLYGAAFRVFGSDLLVARAVAILLGAGATVLVYVAARLLGAPRLGALVGAALSTFLPYSALLGIAAVPEVPCAALIVFGAATLARAEPKLRALGGLALALACLSRYEAWPVAGVFAGCTLWEALKERRLFPGAALALSGPALWLLVGRVEHGSAFFFVTRVASYRRALGPGAAGGSLGARLLEYPGLLLGAEPEIWLVLAVVLVAAWRTREPAALAPYRRAGLALLALLAFMILGSVRDGVPTHHAARVFLPIWFFACALCGHCFEQARRHGARGPRWLLLGLSLGALIAGLLLRSELLPQEGFADRRLELDAGREAKRRALPELVIDTPDYGYLAVEAAYGSPSRSRPLDDHDPRHARPVDAFASRAGLESALAQSAARFLLASGAHAAIAVGSCRNLWQNDGFTLFDCSGADSAAVRGP
jgi:hypothetical protein